MGQKFIGDSQVVLKLDGLRWVQKRNSSSFGYYYLDWEYKGGKGTADYKEEQERDEMYDKLLAALTEKKE